MMCRSHIVQNEVCWVHVGVSVQALSIKWKNVMRVMFLSLFIWKAVIWIGMAVIWIGQNPAPENRSSDTLKISLLCESYRCFSRCQIGGDYDNTGEYFGRFRAFIWWRRWLLLALFYVTLAHQLNLSEKKPATHIAIKNSWIVIHANILMFAWIYWKISKIKYKNKLQNILDEILCLAYHLSLWAISI